MFKHSPWLSDVHVCFNVSDFFAYLYIFFMNHGSRLQSFLFLFHLLRLLSDASIMARNLEFSFASRAAGESNSRI